MNFYVECTALAYIIISVDTIIKDIPKSQNPSIFSKYYSILKTIETIYINNISTTAINIPRYSF